MKQDAVIPKALPDLQPWARPSQVKTDNSLVPHQKQNTINWKKNVLR